MARQTLALVAACALLVACTGGERAAIAKVLDARNLAVSHKDIAAYAALIADDYHARGRTKADLVREMQRLFAVFDAIEMKTLDRVIALEGKGRARCEQTYELVVRKGDQTRRLIEREQLVLVKTPQGWKIAGGI